MSPIIVLIAAAASALAVDHAPAPAFDKVDRQPDYDAPSLATAGDQVWQETRYKVVREPVLISAAPMEKAWPGWRASIPAGAKLRPVPYAKGVKACTADGTSRNTWVGNTLPTCAYDDDSDGTFDRIATQGGWASPIPKVAYTSSVDEVRESPSETRKVVYLEGIAGSTLHLSYREFVDSLARPAFTQDLEFGLQPAFPQDITFKGVHVRLLSASGEGLRYVILR